jgi:aerobic carbon-monoxide dehydrogenase small subunit
MSVTGTSFDPGDTDDETVRVRFIVNGRKTACEVAPRDTLLDCLRTQLELTGTHAGCEMGACAACLVLLDGRAAHSCLMFAVQADGAGIDTIEGLAESGVIADLQAEFHRRNALQCGFCTPGMVMSAIDMVKRHNYELDEHTVRRELDGNLCRCTGYHNIVKAIAAGAKAMAGTAA